MTNILHIELLRILAIKYVLHFLYYFATVIVRVRLLKIVVVFLQVGVGLLIVRHVQHRLGNDLEKVEHLEILAHLSIKLIVQ